MFAACGWTGVSVTNGTVEQGGSGTRMDECEGSSVDCRLDTVGLHQVVP